MADMNLKSSRTRMLGSIGSIACAVFFVAGCNCEQKSQEMEDRSNRFFAQRKKCCDALRDLGHTEEAAACYTELENDIDQTQDDIMDWRIACENDDKRAMEMIMRILLARESGSDLGCTIPNVATTSTTVANVASPLDNVSSITLKLDPVAQDVDGFSYALGSASSGDHVPYRVQNPLQGLSGSMQLVLENDFVVNASANGHVAWIPVPQQAGSGDSRTYKPTQFKLKVSTGDSIVTFKLVDHELNKITIDADGNGSFNAVLKMDAPVELGIVQPEFWAEIPVRIQNRKLHFEAIAIPGLEFAPQLPHGWADWNSDLVVDMSDYTAFMADFVGGQADLNLDGNCNDEDIVLFEEAFFDEFAG